MSKIAIHHSPESFSDLWISYCRENRIAYKVVNCYANDIVTQLSDCDALMWHHSHMNSKDVIFAKQLLFACQQSGMKVFPDFTTQWHFDDKVGQKYLFEAVGAPCVPTYVFYTEENAMNWAKQADFPKVFKLRGGGGSWNVRLVKSRSDAFRIIKRAFGRGFPQYDAISNIKERWRKYCAGKAVLLDVAKGFARLFVQPKYARVMGPERGYVYFQDFIPGQNSDFRLNVIDGHCYACRRYVRRGDFRASGSGLIDYDHAHIPLQLVKLAFDLAEKMNLQSAAFDFIFNHNQPMLLEMSYCFTIDPEDGENGYWTPDMVFHTGYFNPQGWMVDLVVKETNSRK
jgi:glutathione synthase/RimK-type ligase-like ATP-grasp enzyme